MRLQKFFWFSWQNRMRNLKTLHWLLICSGACTGDGFTHGSHQWFWMWRLSWSYSAHSPPGVILMCLLLQATWSFYLISALSSIFAFDLVSWPRPFSHLLKQTCSLRCRPWLSKLVRTMALNLEFRGSGVSCGEGSGSVEVCGFG